VSSPATAFSDCIGSGGVAVFPSDTVYGLACDPLDRAAVARLYELKGRSPAKASAVMWFALPPAFDALPELGPRTREALRGLLPGGVTALLANSRRRFPLACGDDPASLGLRVPAVALLAQVRRPVLQSSANLAGGVDPRRLEEVPPQILAGADLVLDAGELPGTSSTVLDLRRYEADGDWEVLRAGAVPAAQLSVALLSSRG